MRNRVYIVMSFCLSLSAMFYGCAEDASNGGKSEPMLFSTEICNRTQTRTAVDTSKHSGTNLIVHAAEPAKGITLNVNKMTRTSTADGYWPNGANIAVQQGGTTKQYTVDGSGNITSSSPFYWANKKDVSVTSWFPYSASLPTKWLVNSDQSTGSNYNSSDLLYSTSTLSYDGSKTLKFNHETAKVVINIVKANNVLSSSNISSITIGTSGTPLDLSGTTSSDGTVTGSTSNTGYIIPYHVASSNYAATYSALIIPQDVSGKQFIGIKINGGNTFYYAPANMKLSGGYVYTYNVTVPNSNANVGDYYFSDGSWGTLAVHATKTVWPIGIIFSNSPSTIDQGYGWTHGYAMAISDANGGVWCTLESNNEKGDKFGDFVYQEYGGINANDYLTFQKDKDGYSETMAVKNDANNGNATYSSATYPAIYSALTYGTTNETSIFAVPKSLNSGWFLPSVGQWWDIITNLGKMSTTPNETSTGECSWTDTKTCVDNINAYLPAANKSFNLGYNYYWTSSQYSLYTYYGPCFYEAKGIVICPQGGKNTDNAAIRTVIAF